MRVVWLPPAIDDLQRIREFLRPQNPEASRRAVSTIGTAVAALCDNPRLGKCVDDAPDFRDIVIPFGRRNYLLRYRVDREELVIVALRHAREAGFPDPPGHSP